MKTQIAVKNTACGVSCSQCSLSEICLPSGLDAEQLLQLEGLIQHKRKVRRGEHLFRANDALQSLYAIRSGFFKTYVLHEDGRAQVTGFQLAGEILGMDAISGDAHACHAVALEDSEVCVIPFAKLEQLGRELPALQRHLHRLMSREIVLDHGVMLLLGAMRAEERLVTLLLNLSHRYLARGYSGSEFQLRMTREEIGSFLGLKLETVSRAFSKLQQDGLIDVQNKAVQLRDLAALRELISGAPPPASQGMTMSSTAAFEARPAEVKKSPLQWSEERTVFVVEDDEPLRELLQSLMESAGFKTKAYDCAEAFLREVAPRPCGCLLLDIELPGRSGIGLALKLARDGVQLPMILLSGRGDLLFAARKLGIEAAFVSKPFENHELLESVKRALELPKKIKS